jgi:hypothetical protein
MKKQEWNEEQLEQLFQQLPPIKDKRTAEDLYKRIQQTQQGKNRPWIKPAIASFAALLLFAMISPYFYQKFTSSEESAMDMASSSEKIEHESSNETKMEESKFAQESSIEQQAFDDSVLNKDEQETFVTSSNKAEETVTVGFTDSQAQNILPISLKADKRQEKLAQLEKVNPNDYSEQLGPITYELMNTDFIHAENPEEIAISYNGEPNFQSTANEELYQNAIIETLRWYDYKTAKLFTDEKEGIYFSQTGLKKELVVRKESKKAYFLYQYDEQTRKLLVPSPTHYDSIDSAIKAMKQGVEERKLKPTIRNNISIIKTKNSGKQLVVEFDKTANFQNNEQTIIMLESILLTAKEFGYQTVRFNGINLDKVGIMDVTKPIEVPFSPNPIDDEN